MAVEIPGWLVGKEQGRLIDERSANRGSLTFTSRKLRRVVIDALRQPNPVEQFGPLPEQSVWPSIYRLLRDQIREHRSTIIFSNDRRSVERITSFLNDDEELARAHHGSVALEVRQETEQALKEGRVRAVVATASLELGIDMGAVDLVCQVESPGNVARALQRVGRAGHLVGQSSKGRLIPKTLPDLLNQTVLAAEMAAGRVEALKGPNAMIFGRGGAGGVVNRVSKVADFGNSREFSLQGGMFDNRRVTAGINQAVNDKVAFRLDS